MIYLDTGVAVELAAGAAGVKGDGKGPPVLWANGGPTPQTRSESLYMVDAGPKPATDGFPEGVGAAIVVFNGRIMWSRNIRGLPQNILGHE